MNQEDLLVITHHSKLQDERFALSAKKMRNELDIRAKLVQEESVEKQHCCPKEMNSQQGEREWDIFFNSRYVKVK